MSKKSSKKIKVKSKKSKKRAVAIRKNPTAQDLVNMFAGSSSLVQNDKVQERSLILRVAEVFAVPATCVNIMGGLPYINKDGQLFKLNEYEHSNVLSLTTKIIEYATKGGDRAIMEAELILKGGRRFNAIGEADEKSIKLSAVKQTPNMMAETRAQNRVIRRAIQAEMLRELYTKLGGRSAYNDQEKKIIENAVQSSAEEMNSADHQKIRAEIIEDTKPQEQKESITQKDFMERSIERIRSQNSSTELTGCYESINKSDLYTPKQKQILIQEIAKQRKKYAGNN